MKMTPIYKIAYSALFIALGIILSRVLAIPSLFGLPFLKISLTMSIIFFTSFYLGPWYGMLISFAIDLFGALLLPQGGAYDFLYSIPAIVEGFIPYFIYKFLEFIKADRKTPIVLGIILFLLDLLVLVFLLTHDSFSYKVGGKSYEITTTIKIAVPIVFFLLSIIFYIAIIIIKNKFKDKPVNQYYNLYNILSTMFLTYIVFKLPISSLIFMYRLNYSFLVIYSVRMIAAFLTTFIHYIIVVICLGVSLRFGPKGALIKKENTEIKGE